MDDRGTVAARFMEIDGKLAEIGGDVGGIRILLKFQERETALNNFSNQQAGYREGDNYENSTAVFDVKRKRVENGIITEENSGIVENGLNLTNGPKNGLDAGPVNQARLIQ